LAPNPDAGQVQPAIGADGTLAAQDLDRDEIKSGHGQGSAAKKLTPGDSGRWFELVHGSGG